MTLEETLRSLARSLEARLPKGIQKAHWESLYYEYLNTPCEESLLLTLSLRKMVAEVDEKLQTERTLIAQFGKPPPNLKLAKVRRTP